MPSYTSAERMLRVLEVRKRLDRRRRRQLRRSVIQGYGGRCACCGDPNRRFLELDHVNNDGRRERDRGINAYKRALKLNFPPCYQILCTSCNLGKHRNNGVCPHEEGAVKPTWPEVVKQGPVRAARFDRIPEIHVIAREDQLELIDAIGIGEHHGR